MTTDQISTLKAEVKKRNINAHFIISGVAHDGKYSITLFKLNFGKRFLTGTNFYTKEYTINVIEYETIKSVKAIDWDKIKHIEIETKLI